MIINNREIYELTLIITEKCNLKCKYCLVDKSLGRNMRESIAIKEIEIMLSMKQDFSYYIISFMGGEPFINFHTIKRLVDYVSKTHPDKLVKFDIVTNGTLLTEEIKDWIIDNKEHLHITLSLDGQQQSHDANRCGSFEKIDIKFFASLPNATVNMVVSPSEIDSLVDNVIWLERQGFYVKVFYEEGVRWRQENIIALSRQLRILADYYIGHPYQRVSSLLGNVLYILLDPDKPVGCGQHKYAYHVSVDGVRYDCHRCMPFERNNILPLPEEYISNLSKVGYLDKVCETCPLCYICNLCPASIAVRKNKPELASVYCLQRKVTYLAQSYMTLRMALEVPTHVYFSHMSASNIQNTIEVAKMLLNRINISHAF